MFFYIIKSKVSDVSILCLSFPGNGAPWINISRAEFEDRECGVSLPLPAPPISYRKGSAESRKTSDFGVRLV